MSKRRPWTSFEEQVVREQYGKVHPGLIGQRLNRTRGSIHQKAAKLGLAFDRSAEFGPEFDAFFQERYAKGWSDREIAAEWGAWVGTVAKHRRGLGLAKNAFNQRHREKLRQKAIAQCREAGVKNLGALRSLVWSLKTFRDGWPTGVSRGEAMILNALEKLGPSTRRMIAAELGLPWRGCKTLVNHSGRSRLLRLVGMGLVEKRSKRLGQVKGQSFGEYVYALAPGVVRARPDAA